MDTVKLRAILIVGFALLFALYLGVAAATAQLEAVAWVAGGVFLFVCILLGKHIWILIPATLSIKGGFNFLPGSPEPWHLMTLVAATFFLLRVAVRRQRLAIRWSWIETSLFLVGLTIAQAFVRNPVGLSVLGGDVAGGKPYFVFALAFVAFFVVSMSEPDLRTWRWAVILFIGFGLLSGAISALSQLSPRFAQAILPIYSNVSYAQAMGTRTEVDIMETRFGSIANLGLLLGLIACTFWRPLGALDLTRPWRALVAVAGCVATLLSGFRGATLTLFLYFMTGSALRRKWLDISATVIAGILLLALMGASGLATYLPFGIQRSLSPLPIEVDPKARLEARSTAEDRFEMWRLAMGSDRFISNKMLGDGFTLSAREITAMRDAQFVRRVGYQSWIENSMEVGNYHGFHVETIRFTGIAGLAAATMALLAFAFAAWRAIDAFRGSPMWGMVLFICMPYLIYPLYYWLIFGSYRSGYPELIALAGMIKLLNRAIAVPATAVDPAALPSHQRSPGAAPAFADAAR